MVDYSMECLVGRRCEVSIFLFTEFKIFKLILLVFVKVIKNLLELISLWPDLWWMIDVICMVFSLPQFMMMMDKYI